MLRVKPEGQEARDSPGAALGWRLDGGDRQPEEAGPPGAGDAAGLSVNNALITYAPPSQENVKIRSTRSSVRRRQPRRPGRPAAPVTRRKLIKHPYTSMRHARLFVRVCAPVLMTMHSSLD